MSALSIHCGAHKTATKSIQAMLADGRRRLNECGINYIHPRRIEEAVSWPEFYRDAATRSEARLCRVFEEALKADRDLHYVNNPERVVVSHESFFSNVGLRPRSSGFYPRLATTLRKCNDRGIFDLFDKVQLVFIVRRQDHFIASLYLYHLFTGLWSEPFDRLIRRLDLSVLDWWRLARLMADADGVDEVHIRPFESLLTSGERVFTQELLSLLLGDNAPDLGTLGRHNQGLSKPAYALAMRAYPHLGRSGRRMLGQIMRRTLPVCRFGKPELVSTALKEEILRIGFQDNRRLFEDFMPDCEDVKDFYLNDTALKAVSRDKPENDVESVVEST